MFVVFWLKRFSGFIPLVTFCWMSKGCLPKIEQQSTFQHEKLEKQVRSCAPSCLRAKLRGQSREQSFYTSFSLIQWLPCLLSALLNIICLNVNKPPFCMLKWIKIGFILREGCIWRLVRWVCEWECAVHASKLGCTDLRWKDFLSHSNPHRQPGPCDYSRPLLSTHLFECRAFLIHPKKGFKRGLYCW